MKLLRSLFLLIFLLFCLYWLHAFMLIGVAKESKLYYKQLKKELKEKGFAPDFLVLSGKRYFWDNGFLNKYGNAAKNSKHLSGEAIDIVVLDVNKDGKSNAKDVDIVFKILDEQIVKNEGGIGTYKKETNFLSQQMIHFDCRGYWARWHK
ncbi:MAG: hypothetical protein R3E32_01750 [Chitinophagales bacterium]